MPRSTAGRKFFHNAIDSNGVIGDRSSFTGQQQQGPGSDTIRCVMNIMMDHNFFNADPWQTDTYATKYGAYESSHANGVAQQSCNALLGFGLPASSGKAFVDKLWSTTVPKRDYWNGVLYMLGDGARERQVPPLLLTATNRSREERGRVPRGSKRNADNCIAA